MNIQTDNIQVSFGPKTILHDISLDIRNKEFVGIIGPNGSGKSTFLKCLYRVLKPNNGKIFFDGTEMSSLSHRDTALKMAVVAQHSTVNFDFSVLEMVLMGRSPYKGLLDRDKIDDYEIARHALAQVGLSDFESRNFNTLSGGEQQRVILARALAQRTECLVRPSHCLKRRLRSVYRAPSRSINRGDHPTHLRRVRHGTNITKWTIKYYI